MLHLQYHENGFETGQLLMHKPRYLSGLSAKPSVISILPTFGKERQAVEDFIIKIYKQYYGAAIGVHYPILMSARNAEGQILAAVGFRSAADEPLFLEQYLRQPVETMLDTTRERIVEIGNLASDGGGASLFLFAALSVYLHNKGFEKAIMTGTDFLQKRFHAMGLKLTRHVAADASLLLKKDEDWGSYYDTQPHVLSGSIDKGYKHLQAKLGVEYQNSPTLFSRLHYKY